MSDERLRSSGPFDGIAGRVLTVPALTALVGVALFVGARVTTATSTSGATTPAPTTSVVPTTAAVSTAAAPATTTTLPLPVPVDEASDPVRTIVPAIIAVPEVLTTPPDRQSAIAAALESGTDAVAVEAEPGTLCAVVRVPAPLSAAGRWERNGEPIETSAQERRDPPGYGECLSNDDGDAVRTGVYQYLVIGPTGASSAVATVVVGAPTVAVSFVNNGDEPVCLILLSPGPADFYQAYDAGTPLAPGEAVAIRVAQIELDGRAYGCPPEGTVSTFRLEPEAQMAFDLFQPDQTETTAGPTSTAPPTTARPTTTT